MSSADPLQPPAIHPQYLSTEDDLAEMLEGARFLRRLAATTAFDSLIESELRPGAAVQSEAALIADIRARSSTVFHPVGTCAMGADASRAVVDCRLRVHGIERLRVIDASVFPLVPSGNTNAATVMVGEKGADLISNRARAVA